MIGRIVGGTYKIVDKVGEGGMGAVYRAVDTMLDREVAIKAIRPELAREPRIADRFRAEAKILARLSHPAVATIYTFFQEGEELFLAMEFVHGRSLSQVLSLEGALSWRRMVPLLCNALDGIEQAHRLGIIHRDLKPDNLMLTGGDGIKVMDFGIARMAGSGHLTRTGLLVGTLRYMAPEQIRGEEVDPRTDVYSLGAVLYEALTAKVPFDGPTDYSILKAQLEDMPARPTSLVPDLPLWTEEAILRSLAKEPAARFQSAGELRAFLVRNSSTTPVPELPTMVLPKTPLPSAPTQETDRPRLGPPQRTPPPAPRPTPAPPPAAPVPLPVPSATSYRPVSGAAWKIVAAAAFVLLGVIAGIFFWPRSGGPGTVGTDATDETPTPSVSLGPTVAESSPIAIAPATQPSPRQTVPVRPSPRPEPPAQQQPVVLPPTVAEPSLAPAPRESPRFEPTPAPPVREPAPVAPEPAPLDIGTERARELGAELEAASNQLIEVYKQFLDQKEERGEDLTDADEDLEEEIESMIGAAERLNNQIRNNLTRLREKRQTPQGRADLRSRLQKMAANIQKVETLMNEVQPGPEVLKVWRQVTGLWRQVARAAGV